MFSLLVGIWNQRWLPWPLIGCSVFNLLSRTTICKFIRFVRNVPLLEVHKKYLKQFEIQESCLGLWLAETLMISSPELLHAKAPDINKKNSLTRFTVKMTTKSILLINYIYINYIILLLSFYYSNFLTEYLLLVLIFFQSNTRYLNINYYE